MLLRTLATLGRRLSDLDAVLLTHAHTAPTRDSPSVPGPPRGPGPQIMPSGFNRDTPQALRSLDIVEKIPAEVVLPGHGDLWTQGAAEAARLARAAGPS